MCRGAPVLLQSSRERARQRGHPGLTALTPGWQQPHLKQYPAPLHFLSLGDTGLAQTCCVIPSQTTSSVRLPQTSTTHLPERPFPAASTPRASREASWNQAGRIDTTSEWLPLSGLLKLNSEAALGLSHGWVCDIVACPKCTVCRIAPPCLLFYCAPVAGCEVQGLLACLDAGKKHYPIMNR